MALCRAMSTRIRWLRLIYALALLLRDCGPQKYHDVRAARGDRILVVQSAQNRMSESGSWSVEPMPMQL